MQKSNLEVMTMTIQTKPKEITLHYAFVNRQHYVFETEEEAIESGLKYRIATWEDINDMADGGHPFTGVIINTPQGRFVWVEEEDEDCTTEQMYTSDAVYRYYGAPDSFSKTVEDFIFWNKQSYLLGITDQDGAFTAQIQNPDGTIISITGTDDMSLTEDLEAANQVIFTGNHRNLPLQITLGKTYQLKQSNDESYIIDDSGKENYSIWLLCKHKFFY